MSAKSETEKTEEDPSTKNGGHGESNPIPGCIIISTIFVVFGGLVVLYSIFGYLRNKDMDGFTQDEPAKIEVLKPTDEQILQANTRILDVFKAAKGNTMDRVSINADDLNTLIATKPMLKDFREQAFITKISDEGIFAKMTQPVRQVGFGKGKRYLNATFTFVPELRARTVAFKVVAIETDDGPLPKEFVEGYATLDFFRLDPSNETLAPVIRKLGKVYTEGEAVIVETKIEIPN